LEPVLKHFLNNDITALFIWSTLIHQPFVHCQQ